MKLLSLSVKTLSNIKFTVKSTLAIDNILVVEDVSMKFNFFVKCKSCLFMFVYHTLLESLLTTIGQ